MAEEQAFQDAAAKLLREAFEGRAPGKDYTWFVEKQEGIFDALDSANAERASIKPSAECASLAAHAYHLLYSLRLANVGGGGPEPAGTWESSWDQQTATPEEWAELKRNIREQYEIFRTWFAANEDWTQGAGPIEPLAVLPHVAFHLGAMRQILRIVPNR